MYCFGLMLTLLMVTSCSAKPAQAGELAVPGRSVGMIALGMPRAAVWKHWGKPTEIHFLHLAGRFYIWDYWQSEHTARREFVTLYRGRVVQIERDATDAERRRFVFLSIRRQHPQLKAALYSLREESGSMALIDDRRQGSAWSLYLPHTDDFTMGVFNIVGPNKIIVHRRGYAVLPDAGEVADEHNPLLNDFHAWCSAKS